MMLPTHAVVGLAVATPLAIAMPEVSSAALGGALVGSVLPDMDLYAGHRRTLHYPTGYAIVAGLVVAVVLALSAVGVLSTPVRTAGAVTVSFLCVGAALHCQLDRFGGGLELRPWEGTSDRAVYDHVRGRWRSPKRWVRYDGAPEDLLLSGLFGGPLLVVLDPPFRWVVAAALVIACVYVLLRRRLARLAPIVFGALPDRIERYIPNRYRE